jgi:hypothetical protein
MAECGMWNGLGEMRLLPRVNSPFRSRTFHIRFLLINAVRSLRG